MRYTADHQMMQRAKPPIADKNHIDIQFTGSRENTLGRISFVDECLE
jgi:hypothetical protein